MHAPRGRVQWQHGPGVCQRRRIERHTEAAKYSFIHPSFMFCLTGGSCMLVSAAAVSPAAMDDESVQREGHRESREQRDRIDAPRHLWTTTCILPLSPFFDVPVCDACLPGSCSRLWSALVPVSCRRRRAASAGWPSSSALSASGTDRYRPAALADRGGETGHQNRTREKGGRSNEEG